MKSISFLVELILIIIFRLLQELVQGAPCFSLMRLELHTLILVTVIGVPKAVLEETVFPLDEEGVILLLRHRHEVPLVILGRREEGFVALVLLVGELREGQVNDSAGPFEVLLPMASFIFLVNSSGDLLEAGVLPHGPFEELIASHGPFILLVRVLHSLLVAGVGGVAGLAFVDEEGVLSEPASTVGHELHELPPGLVLALPFLMVIRRLDHLDLLEDDFVLVADLAEVFDPVVHVQGRPERQLLARPRPDLERHRLHLALLQA
mmetsp:Transcript_25504/g.24816  ORF Transcript_25504/g.24816 Transcript_25504/m.24816 type:complete len:264 (+) Transcript_25504:19-810(+)